APGPVSTGNSNVPLVLKNDVPLDGSWTIDSNQARRGTRGAIAVDGTYVYLAVIASATVPEIAPVMRALGARDAMNLDGGGSAAMWSGGQYVVGPGRQLPHAILFLKP